MKSLRHMALATLVATSGMAYAQTQNMVVVKKDGTRLSFNVAQIDSVGFREASAMKGAVNLKVDAVHPLYAQFSTQPTGITSYNVMFMSSSEFDELYPTDDNVVADDLAYFKELASNYQMNLSDLLKEFLFTGAATDYVVGVTPATKVVLWGYGLDYTGEQTSPFEKLTFFTSSVEKTEGSVAISVQLDGSTPTVTYTPDDDSRYYMVGYVEKGKSDAEVEAMMNGYISENLGDYLAEGLGVEGLLEEVASKGVFTQDISNLSNASSYDAVAAYVNAEGACCSKVTRVSLGSSTATSSVATQGVKTVGAADAKLHLLKPAKVRYVRVPKTAPFRLSPLK